MSTEASLSRYLRPILPASRFSADAAPSAAPPWRSPSATASANRSTSTRSCARSAAAARACTRSIRCASRSRPSPACTTAPPRASSTSCRSAPPRHSSSKSRSTRAWPRACWPTSSTRKSQGQDIYSFSQSIRLGFDVGLINERVLGFVEANARKLNDAHRCDAHAALRILRPAHALRPLPAEAPHAPAGHRDARSSSGCASPARCRASAAEALELYRLLSSLDYIPSSPTLFNAGTRHEQLSSCFLLDSPEDSLESHLRQVQGHRAAVEVLRRHRRRLPSRALARLADQRHQWPLQRHRAVAEDARLFGRRGQPGRQAQGRGLRLSRAVARGHRGRSSSCATTPATKRGARTT